MAQQVPTAPAILRRKQVEARTGLARSTIYQLMSQGEFPLPVRLGRRAVGWHEAHIDAWIQARAPKAGGQHGSR